MKIYIEELEFDCIIGILEHERKNSQRVVITAHLEYEYKNSLYVDYAKVSELMTSVMQEKKFELLEDALACISSEIHNNFPIINNLYLKITKPDIMKNSKVSLSENYTFL